MLTRRISVERATSDSSSHRRVLRGSGPAASVRARPAGEPSATDFHVFELLRIVERFAVGFDDLPQLIPGRDDYRILIARGSLVTAFAVVGQLAPDGAVELVQLDIETGSPWE